MHQEIQTDKITWESFLKSPEWTSWNPKVGITQYELRWPKSFNSVSRFCVTNWVKGQFEAVWVGHPEQSSSHRSLEEAMKKCEKLRLLAIKALFEGR